MRQYGIINFQIRKTRKLLISTNNCGYSIMSESSEAHKMNYLNTYMIE